MKTRAISAALLSILFVQPVWAADDLIDAIVDQFVAELARKQGYLRLAAPAGDGAKIGSLYWVKGDAVRCSDNLSAIQAQGQPLSVEYLADLKNPPAQVKVENWTTVRLDNFLGASAQAALNARLQGRKGEISAAVGYLKKVNAQVSFAVVEKPSFALRKGAKDFLQEEKIADAGDLGAGATGLLIPYGQLVFQSFQVDQELAKRGEMGVGAQLLNLIGLKLGGNMEAANKYGFQRPTQAVYAFKADNLLLPAKCPA